MHSITCSQLSKYSSFKIFHISFHNIVIAPKKKNFDILENIKYSLFCKKFTLKHVAQTSSRLGYFILK